MKFADFICIGPPKAGTTWMFEQLRHHPQVFIGIKEPNFFGQNTPLVRYAAHFAEANGRLCGDLSPQYSKHPSIAARIYDLLPQAKIIYSLREPARRAFSQWKMARRLGNIPAEMSFRDAFEEDRSPIRTRGEYTKFVEAYRSCSAIGFSSCGSTTSPQNLRPSPVNSRNFWALIRNGYRQTLPSTEPELRQDTYFRRRLAVLPVIL